MEKLAIEGGKPVFEKPLKIEGKRFGEKEEKLVLEVLRSGKLNKNVGEKVREFEKKFADYLVVKHAIMSTSGTAAIHIALGALNLEPGSEILTSPITDMGSIMPIFLTLCVPVFADIDEETWEINPEDMEKKITPRTKAILAIHLIGNSCNMERILEIAKKYNLYVIEDCAQAFETTFQGKKVGKFGKMGCFSLNQHKHITCGDGGITVTNDEKLAERARLFSDKAWPREVGRTSLFVAPNYRVTELQAAVAIAQLDKVVEIGERRNKLGRLLTDLIKEIPGIKAQKSHEDSKHTYWFYAFRVPQGIRDKFVEALRAEGVPASEGYTPKPVYLYEVFQEKNTFGSSHFPYGFPPFRPSPETVDYKEGDCPVAEKLLKEMIRIPLNEFWSKEDVEKCAEAIRKVSYWLIS